MKDEKKAPKLRFKGFTDDWEQCKLGEIASMHARIGWQGLKTSEFLETGDYYLITGTDFENGHINLGKAHYIDKSRYDMDQKLKLKNGDILITKDGTIGKVAYLENLDKPGTLNAGVFIVRPIKKSVYKQYLFHYLAAPFLLKYAKSHSTGGTIQHLNQGIIKNFPVALPSTEEQLVISKFLKSISKTITLHEEKHRQLEQLKKALLQKMFADETGYPVLRFKGFTEKWEQRKLGQLGIISRGLTYRPNDVTDKNGVRVLRSSNIYEDSFVLNDDDVFVNSSVVNVPNLKNGDILVTSANGSSRLVGKHAIIKGLSNKTVHGGFMLAIRPATNSYFLNSLMSTSWYDNFISTFVSGGNGSIGNLKKSDLERQSIFIPLNKEQNKIGQLFQSLEKTITLHDKKIQYLKQLKRGLLQKMFV